MNGINLDKMSKERKKKMRWCIIKFRQRGGIRSEWIQMGNIEYHNVFVQ